MGHGRSQQEASNLERHQEASYFSTHENVLYPVWTRLLRTNEHESGGTVTCTGLLAFHLATNLLRELTRFNNTESCRHVYRFRAGLQLEMIWWRVHCLTSHSLHSALPMYSKRYNMSGVRSELVVELSTNLMRCGPGPKMRFRQERSNGTVESCH